MEVQTPWGSLMYAARPNTFLFHAFGAWTLRAGSWLMRNNSSQRRSTCFYSRNKHLVEVFCREIAFRNKRLNCVLSVLKTQVRYHLVLVFDCVWQSSWGGWVCVCFLSLYSAQHVCVLLEANYYDGGFSGFWHQPGYELRAPLICFHLGHGRTARWE